MPLIQDSKTATMKVTDSKTASLVARDMFVSEMLSITQAATSVNVGGTATTTSTVGDASVQTVTSPTQETSANITTFLPLKNSLGSPTITLSDVTPGGAGTVVNLNTA